MPDDAGGSGTAGYGHARYAASLAEFGSPRALPCAGGWLLERALPGSPGKDAMGCYPLFACKDWTGLADDLLEIGRDLVSIVLIADPFGNHDPTLLGQIFNRGAAPFKEHHVLEFTGPLESIVSSHHRRNVRKAVRSVDTERVADPRSLLDAWLRLYATLIERHQIDGLRAFSRSAFEEQLQVPGLVSFRAVHKSETVGMVLFYVSGDVAYYHLGAYSPLGYEVGAAFAIFWAALSYFADRLRFVSLGGDAGLSGDAGGLSRFKRGWANTTRPAFLCKHVGDAARYAELADRRGETPFFPAYRAGEFASTEAPTATTPQPNNEPRSS